MIALDRSLLYWAIIIVCGSWILKRHYDARTTAPQTCQIVEAGSYVHITFQLTRDLDGKVLDSSDSSGGLDFVCGNAEVLPAMDAGVKGMAVGETRLLPFGNEDGFGARLAENVVNISLAELPSSNLTVGQTVTLPSQDGARNAVVAAFNETTATLDFNHPNAGEAVTMAVTLVSCHVLPEEDGLRIETNVTGDNRTYPRSGNMVAIHYTGSFAESGKIFGSSREKGEEYRFKVGAGQVIKGLEKGVTKMSLGERATLFIPPDLAFATQGNAVPLAKAVVFDVELLRIGTASE
eukprot:CAMPEP_0172698722 /NCGR_PEP_ID=MMETSP1074-20121228/29673_1 /TAXON_ID=2916 /ORGANISM="Ceratium fusus, Strain PA161109" /LENGTH=292 /DNA_ID=CAMNT_0013519801 /DNA_START=73 /DNA_END=951 /DNA_ORIENTATION=-